MDNVTKDERGSKKLKEKVDEGIQAVLEDYYLEISGKWGDNGGGDNSLELWRNGWFHGGKQKI